MLVARLTTVGQKKSTVIKEERKMMIVLYIYLATVALFALSLSLMMLVTKGILKDRGLKRAKPISKQTHIANCIRHALIGLVPLLNLVHSITYICFCFSKTMQEKVIDELIGEDELMGA